MQLVESVELGAIAKAEYLTILALNFRVIVE